MRISDLREVKSIAPAMAAQVVLKKDYAAWKEWQDKGGDHMSKPYGRHSYRVDGWYCPQPPPDKDDWLGQVLWDSGEWHDKLMPCLRKDATHVAASSVGGILKPVDELVVIGRVKWTPEQIADAEKNWARRVRLGY